MYRRVPTDHAKYQLKVEKVNKHGNYTCPASAKKRTKKHPKHFWVFDRTDKAYCKFELTPEAVIAAHEELHERYTVIKPDDHDDMKLLKEDEGRKNSSGNGHWCPVKKPDCKSCAAGSGETSRSCSRASQGLTHDVVMRCLAASASPDPAPASTHGGGQQAAPPQQPPQQHRQQQPQQWGQQHCAPHPQGLATPSSQRCAGGGGMAAAVGEGERRVCGLTNGGGQQEPPPHQPQQPPQQQLLTPRQPYAVLPRAPPPEPGRSGYGPQNDWGVYPSHMVCAWPSC